MAADGEWLAQRAEQGRAETPALRSHLSGVLQDASVRSHSREGPWKGRPAFPAWACLSPMSPGPTEPLGTARSWRPANSATFWPHLSFVALALRLPRRPWCPGVLLEEAFGARLCLLMSPLTMKGHLTVSHQLPAWPAVSWAQMLTADFMNLEFFRNYGLITTGRSA